MLPWEFVPPAQPRGPVRQGHPSGVVTFGFTYASIVILQ